MPRYELVEGTSSKFWQIELDGASFKTTHGRIGTSGSTLLKEWPNEEAAQKEYDKLIAQKTKKGYELVDDGSSAKAGKAAKAAPAKAKAKGKAVEADEEDEPKFVAGKDGKAVPVGKAAKGKAGAKAPGGKAVGVDPSLAKQIDADPDDAAAWSVYADWLLAEGDPRGELGITQERLRASPKDKGLIASEKKLLKEHAEQLYGSFKKYTSKKKDIGVLAKHPLEPQFRTGGNPALQVFWRGGFWEELIVSHPGLAGSDDGNEDGEELGEVFVDKLLGEVLAHPSARFLSKLRLGMPMDPEDGEQDYADVIKALAKTEALGRLRELFIGDITQEESEISWVNVGDLSPLYKTAKNLRKLTIHAGSDVKLGKLELPELRELVIITGGFDKKNLASILSAKLPKLEVLEIWFGRPNYGGNCTMKDLKPLLDGKASFPKLKELGICNCEFADEVAAALATSKILPKLESLDLSKGTLTDTGVTAMLEHADAFQHLRKINLSDNYVGKTSAAAAKLCKAVRTRPQRTPDNWDGEDRRYAALGE